MGRVTVVYESMGILKRERMCKGKRRQGGKKANGKLRKKREERERERERRGVSGDVRKEMCATRV
jgi:hypothetical protein